MSGPTEKNWIANLVAVGIGCAVVVLALVAIQWFFGQSDMDRRHAKIKDDVSEAFYDSNSDEFGWKFIPNVKSHVVRKIGDQVVYDFHLTIDQYGRRVVQHEEKDGPPANGKAKDEFLLFFGGSFMVGEGLPDEQTLEYRLGEKLPQYKTYNYAVNGYGLGNVMAQADLIPFGEQIPQRKERSFIFFLRFTLIA